MLNNILNFINFEDLVIYIGTTFVVSFLLNLLFIKIAEKFDITDKASSAPNRKIQKKPIPLLGFTGSFITISVFVLLLALELQFGNFGIKKILQNGLFVDFNLFYILIGSVFIYILGIFDDKFNLKPKIYFPLIFISLLFLVLGGDIKIEAFSAPFDWINLKGNPLSYFLSFIWLGMCMSSTKFLDGHDGLVASVGVISFTIIMIVSGFEVIDQPLIYLISLFYVISCLGFLPLNLPNAKAYLGEGGSTHIGLWIGILSILSGAKIATIFSVLGWFIIDIIFVLIFRYRKNGIKNILEGDSTLHWHHRLKRLGFGKWQVLSISVALIALSSIFGLFLPTLLKMIFFFIQLFMVYGSFILVERKRE